MVKVFAVRVHTSDGSVLDLLLFRTHEQAARYAAALLIPLGLDWIEVVARVIIG